MYSVYIYHSCKLQAKPLKNDETASVFVLHDLGGSHVGCFDSCMFTFCQSHNALHTPGERAFQTPGFSLPVSILGTGFLEAQSLEAEG